MSGLALGLTIALVVAVVCLGLAVLRVAAELRRVRGMLAEMRSTLDDVAVVSARAETAARDAAALAAQASNDGPRGLPALAAGDAAQPTPSTLGARVARSGPAIKAAGVAAGASRAVKHLRGDS